MGACLGKSDTAASWPDPLPSDTTASSWPDLLPEIADLVLRRLPDHDDRLSFGAVCREWRLAARRHPLPPAMPYVNLAYSTYKDIGGGGKARRFPTPNGCRVRASLDGGWLLYRHKGSRRCFLRRPFSSGAAAIELPRSLVEFPTAWTWELRTRPSMFEVGGTFMDMKMVVCSSRLVVALFCCYHGCASYLASFRPHRRRRRPVWSFVVQPRDDPYPDYVYTDIAFHDGKVFALSALGAALLPRRRRWRHRPAPAEVHCQAMPRANNHLVVSADKQKLLMVRWRSNDDVNGHPTMDLSVFEADFSAPGSGWR